MKKILYSTLFLMSLSAASYADQCGNTGTADDKAKTSSSESADTADNKNQRSSEE